MIHCGAGVAKSKGLPVIMTVESEEVAVIRRLSPGGNRAKGIKNFPLYEEPSGTVSVNNQIQPFRYIVETTSCYY